MATAWTWVSIVLLSMTPNLVLGPSAAIAVGIESHIPMAWLLPVVSFAGFVEGMAVAWLAGRSTNIGIVHRWIERMRSPRSLAFASRWGIWGGMTIGNAIAGQEPVLVALRWLDVSLRRLWLPVAFGNVLFSFIYYYTVQMGLEKLGQF